MLKLFYWLVNQFCSPTLSKFEDLAHPAQDMNWNGPHAQGKSTRLNSRRSATTSPWYTLQNRPRVSVSTPTTSRVSIRTMGTLDKAAVSRALKGRHSRGSTKSRDVPNNAQRRTLETLSKAGKPLLARISDDILTQHERLMGQLSQ